MKEALSQTFRSRRPRVKQRYRVLALAHSQGAAGINRALAATEIGCYELASRIGELEAEGVAFQRTSVTSTNVFGDPVHYTRYVLTYVPPALVDEYGLRAP